MSNVPPAKRSAQSIKDVQPHKKLKTTEKSEILHQFDEVKHDETPQQRESSPILQLRKLFNWTKAVLLRTNVRQGACVLDLGCGRGADLVKYEELGVGHYVGVDEAFSALESAVHRYNAMRTASFPAQFIWEDATQASINKALDPTLLFDATSCQLSLQYAWRTEQEARTFMRNATDRLKPGGIFVGIIPDPLIILEKLEQSSTKTSFGNSLYSIDFQHLTADEIKSLKQQSSDSSASVGPFGIRYSLNFPAAGLINCPEYFVTLESLERIASDYGLDCGYSINQHSFFNIYSSIPSFKNLFNAFQVSLTELSPEEWDIAGLYSVFVFHKRREASVFRRRMLTSSDIVVLRPDQMIGQREKMHRQFSWWAQSPFLDSSIQTTSSNESRSQQSPAQAQEQEQDTRAQI